MPGKRARRHFSQLREPGGSFRVCLTRSTIRADVGVAIVPQTISRHLAEANLKSKRPFRELPLTPEHRQLRLPWCKARSMWNDTYWQKAVFSDESRFVLGTDDNRVRMWRRPGAIASPLSIPPERAMLPTGKEATKEGTSELNRIRWDRKRGRRASAEQ
ncbi:transposable element Tcb2 transposase [Trichonephila clavipes]|nr:transposable element Tcb2 transposase [Trichonephila clavipes]